MFESQSTENLLNKSTGFLFLSHAKLIAMGDQQDRLISARKAAGFVSARSAAIRHHWKESTYASHENGQTDLPKRAAAKYAKAFKVSLAWLLTAEGEMRPGGRARFVKLFDSLPPEKQPQAIEYLEFLRGRGE